MQSFSDSSWWRFVFRYHVSERKTPSAPTCTAGYIFGLLDSRAPRPNLSKRGMTLLLLMLWRGAETWVMALLALTRVKMSLAMLSRGSE